MRATSPRLAQTGSADVPEVNEGPAQDARERHLALLRDQRADGGLERGDDRPGELLHASPERGRPPLLVHGALVTGERFKPVIAHVAERLSVRPRRFRSRAE